MFLDRNVVLAEEKSIYYQNRGARLGTLIRFKKVTVEGNNLNKIGEGAFKGCKKLTEITLKKGVSSIGKNAFYGDKNLKKIKINSTKINKIGKGAFKNINRKATIYIPKSLNKKQAKKYKKMINESGVPKSVKIKKK